MGTDAPAYLTLLQAPGKRLTKEFGRDRKGRIYKAAYDNAAFYHSRRHEVRSVHDLADLLRRLQDLRDCCVIQAAPSRWHPGEGRLVRRRIYAAVELVDDQGRLQRPARKGTAEVWQQQQLEAGRLRRATMLPAFEEVPTRILLLDFERITMPAGIPWRDDLAYSAAFLRRKLPAELQSCACVYYATSSAADPTKPDLGGDEIRMRLGFVLDRGVTFAEAKVWLASVEGLDQSTLRPAQPVYTARPVFCDGLADPLSDRLGVLGGEIEIAPVPEIRVEQRYRREAFAGLGPVRSADGLGLIQPHPRLDAALARLDEAKGAAGAVRSGLIQAAFAYAADAGRGHVDIEALAAFLAEAAEQYRPAAEVAAYGIENLIAWALERSPDDPPPRPHYPARGLPASEAAARLKAEMATAVGEAVAWRATGAEDEPPPVVGIKAGAGIGKTGTALEQIAATPGIEQMNVEIYVPSHRLAEELAERVRAIRAAPHGSGIDVNAELRVLVIRGRGATDSDGNPLCEKSELAEKIGKSGLSVSGHLCKLKSPDGGETQYCPFYAGCRYLAQFRDDRPAIRIFSHASMFIRRNKALPEPDLIVVDEAFWQVAVPAKPSRLALDRVAGAGRWRSRPRKGESPFKAADRLLDAEDFALRVRSAFEEDRDPRTVVTAEDCKHVAGIEWNSRTGPGIEPGMSYADQNRIWDGWQRDECAKAGRFWDLLADEHRFPERPLQRIVLKRDQPTSDGDRRHVLELHGRKKLHLAAAPVILLDADLDPVIAAKFFPDIRVVDIPVQQQAEIIQIVDKTCSKRFLLGADESDQTRAGNRLAELERFAKRVLAQGGLFVGRKAAHGRIKLPATVDAVYLGHLRGMDGFKHHNVAVIAGRMEPLTGGAENAGRAMFGDEAEPIVTVAPDERGRTRYPTEPRRYRMTGGAAGQAVDVAVHPDSRVQRLLQQVRECELTQAIARLRLVHRDRPARIYLLTNIPLDLEVTTLTTWHALMCDRAAEAVERWNGVWPCSASERAKAAPDLWATAQAAEDEHRRKGVARCLNNNLKHSATPFPPYPGWDHIARHHAAATLVEYRRAGQRGSPHRAYVPGAVWCPDAARANLEDVVGPVASVVLVGAIQRERPALVEAVGEPAPMAMPFVGLHPTVMIPVDEAFAFAGRPAVRRTLAGGHIATVPMREAAGWSHLLALRRPPGAAGSRL